MTLTHIRRAIVRLASLLCIVLDIADVLTLFPIL